MMTDAAEKVGPETWPHSCDIEHRAGRYTLSCVGCANDMGQWFGKLQGRASRDGLRKALEEIRKQEPIEDNGVVRICSPSWQAADKALAQDDADG